MCRGVANPVQPRTICQARISRPGEEGTVRQLRMTVRWWGAFARVLALAVLGWAASSGAASPVVSAGSEFLLSGRPTAGRRPDS